MTVGEIAMTVGEMVELVKDQFPTVATMLLKQEAELEEIRKKYKQEFDYVEYLLKERK
jgi:hypothetical protein